MERNKVYMMNKGIQEVELKERSTIPLLGIKGYNLERIMLKNGYGKFNTL